MSKKQVTTWLRTERRQLNRLHKIGAGEFSDKRRYNALPFEERQRLVRKLIIFIEAQRFLKQVDYEFGRERWHRSLGPARSGDTDSQV